MNQDRLSQRIVVDRAIGLIEVRGGDRLTMRELGAELGVEAMALYRYVSNKADLLDLVTATVIGEMDHLSHDQSQTWPDLLRHTTRQVQTLTADHPQVFILMATRPTVTPGLRPPLTNHRWATTFLHRLRSHGLDDSAAVTLYRALAALLLGYLLPQALTTALQPSPGATHDQTSTNNPGSADQLTQQFPALARSTDGAELHSTLENLISYCTTIPATRR